jgi:hypothetical protein
VISDRIREEIKRDNEKNSQRNYKKSQNVAHDRFQKNYEIHTLDYRPTHKNEIANRGAPGGLALPDKGRGTWGMGVAPYPVALI